MWNRHFRQTLSLMCHGVKLNSVVKRKEKISTVRSFRSCFLFCFSFYSINAKSPCKAAATEESLASVWLTADSITLKNKSLPIGYWVLRQTDEVSSARQMNGVSGQAVFGSRSSFSHCLLG